MPSQTSQVTVYMHDTVPVNMSFNCENLISSSLSQDEVQLFSHKVLKVTSKGSVKVGHIRLNIVCFIIGFIHCKQEHTTCPQGQIHGIMPVFAAANLALRQKRLI